jgi:hypothetical protein
MEGDVVWSEKWTSNKSKSYYQNIQRILGQFYENIFGWFFMESHLQKLKLCFPKCKEYGNNLNLDKCAFMVFSRMILGFIISKEGKLPNPKKIQAIVNMPPPKNP